MAHNNTTDYMLQGGSLFLNGAVSSASYTIGAEATNAILTTIQLKDAEGDNLAAVTPVLLWLSDNTDGSDVAGTAPNTSVVFGTGHGEPLVTDKVWFALSDSSGVIAITTTETGADTWYWGIQTFRDGITVSGAMTFA